MTGRPSMAQAIRNKIEADAAAKEAATADERAARRAQLDADAKLYGTPGWDALPAARRHLVALHVLQAQQQGGDDAA